VSTTVYLELALRDDVLLDELVGVLLQHDRLRANLLVHDGLREHWLVSLIVSITSIAHLSYTLPVLALMYQPENDVRVSEHELTSHSTRLPNELCG